MKKEPGRALKAVVTRSTLIALLLSAAGVSLLCQPASAQKTGGATTNGFDPVGDEGGGGGGGPTPTPTPTGGDIVPPHIYTLTPGGINVAEGGINFKQVDLSIGSLELERFYDGVTYDPNGPPQNDADPQKMFFGTHSDHVLDIYVSPTYVKANNTPGTITYPQHWHTVVHMGSGSSGTYYQTDFTSSGSLAPDDGEAEKGELSYNSGVYTYTDTAGAVYQFNPAVRVGGNPPNVDTTHSQRIASITYPDGRIRSYSYDSGGLLKLVSDTSGYAIAFDYNANGLISAACGFDTSRTYVTATATCASAPLKTGYSYTNSALTSFTDVLQQVTTYAYASSAGGLVSCIQPPGYASCKITNNVATSRGITQTLADGSVWQLSGGATFARNADDYVASDGDIERTVTDPAGKQSTYTFTGSTPYDATDANNHTTHYVFIGGSDVLELSNQTVHMGSLLQEADLPEGNKFLAEYNGPFHAVTKQTLQAKAGSGLADRVVQMTYVCSIRAACAKPITKVDANGNTSNWSYTAFGAPAWEMQPPPTSGAARPLKLYAYVQKYAYILNASSQLVASGGAIWLPASITECQTTAGSNTAACDSGAPVVTTTFEYGADGTADNLLLRGKVVTSGGVSYRTCYGYDQWSNKISEAAPRAGLAVCS